MFENKPYSKSVKIENFGEEERNEESDEIKGEERKGD